MKKYLLVFLFFPSIAFSQITGERIKDNLQKYWNYRERLDKYFVVLDPSNRPGTNIPAAFIKGNTIDYNDGNGTLQYYLGLLATEYALLKMNNLDYLQTKNQLKWALNAVDRIDLNAEKYFRDNGSVDSENDLNGFFIRDDVDENIKWHPNYPEELKCEETTINSMFTQQDTDPDSQVCGKWNSFINSRDNVWHYLLNLALVVKLVDDPDIKLQAQKIAYRMVRHFWGWSNSGLLTCWYVENPVCHDYVSGGGEVDVMKLGSEICEYSARVQGMRWGFVGAVNEITKGSGIDDVWQKMKIVRKEKVIEAFYAPVNWIWELNDNSRPYSRLSLSTVIGNSVWQEYNSNHLYDFLESEKNASAQHFEHFPLIYQILHGDDPGRFDKYDMTEINWYLDLFDGLVDVSDFNEYSSDKWWSSNRLVWAQKPGSHRDKDLSHIDFMLLYNLFRLVYVEKMEHNLSSDFFSCNNANTAQNNIFDFSRVNSGCSLVNEAGNKIVFQPGFKAFNGSTVKARIINMENYRYEKLDTDKDIHLHYLDSKCTKLFLKSNARLTENTSQNLISKNDSKLMIYPNPSFGFINVSIFGMNGKKQLNVFNVSGELIYTTEFTQDKYDIDLSRYQAGFYYIQITNFSETISEKLILE